MALFRKFFYRKPPDGLLEISERVYVFDCCFTTDAFEDERYKGYMSGIVHQLKDHFPDASFMVFNFREGETTSQIAAVLSQYDMTVMDYPRQYEGCPLLSIEMVHHFLRSGESWLSLGQQNLVLMHCERGGWPVLAFMLAALLVYRKQYGAELKTLDMIYKQAPRELLQLICPLNPLPSQLRYLHYISRRNVGSEWPPLDRALTLDCIILRDIPSFSGEGGCRPVFRIYGLDPLSNSDRHPKLLFATQKKSKLVRLYKQVDCELVKIDIGCHIQGDVVLECINLDGDLVREEMMFRFMFNTAFIRSNILMLNRDEIDILWDAKDQFPKGFRTEVLFSEMDTTSNIITTEASSFVEKEGLPIEAFAKVQEFFSDIDWLDHHGAAQQILRRIGSTNSMLERRRSRSPQRELIGQHEKLELGETCATKPILEKHSSLPLSTRRRVELEETSTLPSMQENHGLHPPHACGNVESEEKDSSVFLRQKLSPLSPLRRVAFPKEGEELGYNIGSESIQEKYGSPPPKSEVVISPERVSLEKRIAPEHNLDTKNEVVTIPQGKVAMEPLLMEHPSLSLHEKQKFASVVEADTQKSLSSFMDTTEVIPAQLLSNDQARSIQERIDLVSSHQDATVELLPTVNQDKVVDGIKVVPAQILPNDQQKIESQSMQGKDDLAFSHQDATVELGSTVHQDKVMVQKKHRNSSDFTQGRDEPVYPQKDQESIQQAENLGPTFPLNEAKSDDKVADNQTILCTSAQGGLNVSMPEEAPKTSLDNELSKASSALELSTSSEPELNLYKTETDSPSSSPSSTCISPPADIKSEHLANQQPKAKIISQRIPLSMSTPALGITDLLQDHTAASVGPVQKISVVTASRPPSPSDIATPKDKVNTISKPPCPPPPPPPPLPPQPSHLKPVGSIPVPPPPPPPPVLSVATPLSPPQLPSLSSSPQSPLQSFVPPPSLPLASVVPPPPPPPLPLVAHPPPPPPPPQLPQRSSVISTPPPPPPPPPRQPQRSSVVSTPPPPPPPPCSATASSPSIPLPKPSLSPSVKSTPTKTPSPPPPPPPSFSPLTPTNPTAAHPSSKQSPISTSKPSPPPPPPPGMKTPPGPPTPPPPAVASLPQLRSGGGGPPPPPNGMKAPPMKGKLGVGSRSLHNAQTKKNLKPLHWVKVTRAMQGSLWAEEAKQAPVIDMAELECLFSAVVPTSDTKGSADKPGGRSSAPRNEKIHLIDLRKANNCGIMLTKVKMPLSDLMGAILALDDTVLDGDQVENLIKFTPTKEEIELLKDFKGDRESLGECERVSMELWRYFLELMKVPRVESKLRVFSFKIQFRSQISDLGRNLNIVNSCAEEIKGSVKFKSIMQTILSLGNALNQGTARGSAVGFRLDSLLKLSDTRARNNKMTLMHYLCKVLAEKLPELLDFHKDLVSLEHAVKIQLKSLAEEMQAVNKGLEKVEQELSTSESDGPVSDTFRKTLKEFLDGAEADVRALAQLYSSVGRNADALARYFGEDPARCPFEQVVSTIMNFVKMFIKAHDDNCKQIEQEKKKALKAAENEKLKQSAPTEEQSSHPFRLPKV